MDIQKIDSNKYAVQVITEDEEKIFDAFIVALNVFIEKIQENMQIKNFTECMRSYKI